MSTGRPGPVVVGVDGSAASQTAVVRAAWEAERRGVTLLMVYGYLVPTPCLTPLAPLLDEQALLATAQEQLARTAGVVRSRRPRLPITTRAVPAGGGAALIQESAGAGLVVVGSPRVGEFAGLSIGSVAAQVMAQACCPVLVVPRTETGPRSVAEAGPVLVGVDDEHHGTDGVLRFGFEEASSRDVALVAVHVWSAAEPVVRVFGGAEPDSARERAMTRFQVTAEHRLADALAGWQERYQDVKVRQWVVHSAETARMLLDVAGAVAADLIVVGSRGRGPVTGAVLGSVSQALIGRAAAPVAVIGPLAGPRGGDGVPVRSLRA